jgi:cbb3-type cytochrome oxidase maturation protein
VIYEGWNSGYDRFFNTNAWCTINVIDDLLMNSLFILIPISLAMGIVVLAVVLWAARRDQFDDPEGAKYRMLDDE